ncbi:Sal-like protein 4 like protein [Argiope bruennichi]|uniref:Sal-like protein 4 like protein n=1 Tax=Argiope bruennichi TaxID=94029 RepID=A0A8T0E6D2_ARGBR|nr:Sal-like protein 4 like protein [Argiope bruennichi]
MIRLICISYVKKSVFNNSPVEKINLPPSLLHMCNFCSYSTPYKSNLVPHLRKHTGERPFLCKICGNKNISLGKEYISHEGMIIAEISKEHADVQNSKSCSVLAKEKTLIPPRSECLIQWVSEISALFRYAVTDFPSQVSQKSVLVAASLVDLNTEAIPVRVLNLNNKPKIVKKGTVIASCDPVVDIVQSVEREIGVVKDETRTNIEAVRRVSAISRRTSELEATNNFSLIELTDIACTATEKFRISFNVAAEHGKVDFEQTVFKCSYCPYIAGYKSHLAQHLRKHTGERPFVCKLCGRGFTQKQNLHRHLISHQ